VEGPDAAKKAAAYDVEIEIDDPNKAQMNAFMMPSKSQQVSYKNGSFLYISLLLCSVIFMLCPVYTTIIFLTIELKIFLKLNSEITIKIKN